MSSEIDRILSQYGQGYTAPQLNSGDGEIADTAGILSQYTRRNEGLPGVLRGWAGNVRAASRPDNMLAGGLDTAANWVAGEPQVGPDTLAPLGLGIMGSMLAPANSVGIFGGRLARTADRESLSRAEEMAGRGMDRNTIWNQTGWFQGVDGKWRFEINDQHARIPDPTLGQLEQTGHTRGTAMRSGMTHPELYEAYPDLMRLSYNYALDPSAPLGAGRFRDSAGHVEAAASRPDTLRSVALHELQHAVQREEGFAPGGNSLGVRSMPEFEQTLNRTLLESAAEGDPPLSPGGMGQLRDIIASKIYHELAGEVEARNVQRRRDFSPPGRDAIPPWRSQDVPDADQILRQYSAGPQMSVPRYTLSDNVRAAQHGEFGYHIMQDGKKIGSATGRILMEDGEPIANITWLGATGQQNQLGTEGIRQLREAFRRDFPEVTRFEGTRVSGARQRASQDTGRRVSGYQHVRLRSDTGLPLASMLNQRDQERE